MSEEDQDVRDDTLCCKSRNSAQEGGKNYPRQVKVEHSEWRRGF